MVAYPAPYSQIIGTGRTSSYSGYPAAAGATRKVSRRGPSTSRRATSQLGGMRYGAQPYNRSTNQPGLGQSSAQQQSPIDVLLEQLLGILGAPVGQVDESDLMGQIRSQIDPVFDARRNAIQALIERAEQRTATGRKDVEGMYNALSKNYLDMIPGIEQQAGRATAQTEELFGQLKSNIEGNYARIQQEQADLFEQLGIEEAAPAVLDDQATQQLASLNAAEATGAANIQRSKEIGNIDKAYYQQGAPLARLEGANRSSDLLSQLMDYLAEREGELGELEAQRQSEITGSFNQLFGGAQESAANQSRWNQEQLIKLLMSERDRMFSKESSDEFQSPALAFLGQSGLPPQSQQELYDALGQIQQNPDVISGRQNDRGAALPNTRTSITPERIKQIARALAVKQGMNPAETEALLRLIDVMYG